MSDALSFAEIDGQCVELLPARTMLSMFVASGGGTCGSSSKVGGLGGTFGGFTGSAIQALGVPINAGGATGDAGGSTAAATC
jgi:hypothetical protein